MINLWIAFFCLKQMMKKNVLKIKNYVFYNWNNKEEYSSNIWMPYFEEIEGYNMDVIKEEYRNSQILQKCSLRFVRRLVNESKEMVNNNHVGNIHYCFGTSIRNWKESNSIFMTLKWLFLEVLF